MIKQFPDKLDDLITLETFTESSQFAIYIVEIRTFKLIYANKEMQRIMANTASDLNCWQSIYGLETPCMHCKVKDLSFIGGTFDNKSVVYDSFNDIANKWYQVQERVIKLKNGKDALISLFIDITEQKESQSKLIQTHVNLFQKTQILEETQQELQYIANHDFLTNLYNRRYFMEISHQLIALAKREGIVFSLIMLDIDKFKCINDTYGHDIGDEVLKVLANKLRTFMRKSDIVARLGGEEFVIILQKTGLKDAENLANKIIRKIENMGLTTAEYSIKFTLSAGVALFNDKSNTTTIHDTLNRADKALYTAKKSGRNRVCVAL